MHGTVKQLLDALGDMKKIYSFKDEDTFVRLRPSDMTIDDCMLAITTKDEDTGIQITMEKNVRDYESKSI